MVLFSSIVSCSLKSDKIWILFLDLVGNSEADPGKGPGPARYFWTKLSVNSNSNPNPKTVFFKKKIDPDPRSTDTRNYQQVASCSSLKTHFHKLI